MPTIKDYGGGKLSCDSDILCASVPIVKRLTGIEALLSLGLAAEGEA